MKVYAWVLALAAIVFVVRWALRKVKDRKALADQAVRKQGSALSRAERDRKDIEALTRGITEPARVPGADKPSSGAARQERGRRAASHSDFDPDMPVPRRDAAAGE